MLTRKHFQAIADALSFQKPILGADARYTEEQALMQEQWSRDCRGVADALRRFNPTFDREKFLAACGIPS